MQDKRLVKGSRESRIGARPIHILLRSGTGWRLGSKDDEEHDATSHDYMTILSFNSGRWGRTSLHSKEILQAF